MITHDDSEMAQFEMHWRLGRGEFDDLVEMAEEVPGEIHLFKVRVFRGETVSVAVAISPEAQADLEWRMSDATSEELRVRRDAERRKALGKLAGEVEEAGLYFPPQQGD
jgi:hypothetical protein